jgi:hypothetical protein
MVHVTAISQDAEFASMNMRSASLFISKVPKITGRR